MVCVVEGATSTFLALETRRPARPSIPNNCATLSMTAWMRMSLHMRCRPTSHMLNPYKRWCQVACLSLVRARAPQALASAMNALLLVQEIKTF